MYCRNYCIADGCFQMTKWEIWNWTTVCNLTKYTWSHWLKFSYLDNITEIVVNDSIISWYNGNIGLNNKNIHEKESIFSM